MMNVFAFICVSTITYTYTNIQEWTAEERKKDEEEEEMKQNTHNFLCIGMKTGFVVFTVWWMSVFRISCSFFFFFVVFVSVKFDSVE